MLGHENISKSRGEFNMSHVSCLETKGKRSVIRPTERNAHRENDDFEQTQDSMSFGFDAEEGSFIINVYFNEQLKMFNQSNF